MSRSDRGVSPVVGTVALVACCVAASGTLALAVTGVGGSLAAPSNPGVVAAAATADGHVSLTYRAGPPLDVRSLRVRVTVNGRPLRDQPSVPFVGCPGFVGAPAGPFNAAADPTWTAGERAGFRIARSNARLRPGDRVVVRLVRRGRSVAVAAAVVR